MGIIDCMQQDYISRWSGLTAAEAAADVRVPRLSEVKSNLAAVAVSYRPAAAAVP